ncbi:MAG: hypothetical protein OPY03_03010, partial [Nitrosopumilus sp.]|nr:hypothetical protein [Nitrosopumilus sp.]
EPAAGRLLNLRQRGGRRQIVVGHYKAVNKSCEITFNTEGNFLSNSSIVYNFTVSRLKTI